MTLEMLQSIAAQVLDGKKLHEIDFGERGLKLEEKLSAIDQALRHFPSPYGESPGKSTRE